MHQGASKTTGRRYRLSRKVSFSVLRAHGRELGGAGGAVGLVERPKPGEGGEVSAQTRVLPL